VSILGKNNDFQVRAARGGYWGSLTIPAGARPLVLPFIGISPFSGGRWSTNSCSFARSSRPRSSPSPAPGGCGQHCCREQHNRERAPSHRARDTLKVCHRTTSSRRSTGPFDVQPPAGFQGVVCRPAARRTRLTLRVAALLDGHPAAVDRTVVPPRLDRLSPRGGGRCRVGCPPRTCSTRR